jgi:hypothetical protein
MFSSGRVSMENAPHALAGLIPAAGALDGASLKPWTMGKSRSAPEEREHNSREHASSVDTLTQPEREKTPLPPGFTLRVKPDRRRVQLPYPAELDRRRKR